MIFGKICPVPSLVRRYPLPPAFGLSYSRQLASSPSRYSLFGRQGHYPLPPAFGATHTL